MLSVHHVFCVDRLLQTQAIAWHPVHPLLVSGGSEGDLLYWDLFSPTNTNTAVIPASLPFSSVVTPSEPRATLSQAHDSNIWSLAFHPLGHLLASASNDHTTRFWSRERPGDSSSVFSGGGEKPPEAAEGEGEDDGDDAWGQDEGENALPGLGGMPGLYDQNVGGGGGWEEQAHNGGKARNSMMYDDSDVLPGFGPTDMVMDSTGGQGISREYGTLGYGANAGGGMSRAPLPQPSAMLPRPGEDPGRKKTRWGP